MRLSPFTISLPLLAALAAATAAAAPRPAAPPDTGIVVEISMRRTAELSDSRGTLRVFDQDVRVEYRVGGRGPGLDAGVVTLDGRPLRAEKKRNGAVAYRGGRDESEQAGGSPWVGLINAGSPAVPADTLRVKLAPYPALTRPTPRQGVARYDELGVVMLPPVADVWTRVSLEGSVTITGLDLGEGRWLFPRGSLERLDAGFARLRIEVETSCAACPASTRLRATWSSRTELEVPLTML